VSAPANKQALDQLQKIVDENDKAGDWLFSSLPGAVVPIRIDRAPATSEELVKVVGKVKIPRKK
jgi:hypothetical protein